MAVEPKPFQAAEPPGADPAPPSNAAFEDDPLTRQE